MLPLTPATGPPDDPNGSVTAWLAGLKAGDPDASRQLWKRYFRRMVQYSHGRLWGANRAATDEEDVALSAFDSFCRGATGGKFADALGRDRLWPLLVHIICQKAADKIAHDRCAKRGGRATHDEARPLDALTAPDLPPDLLAQLADDFAALLDRLPDPSLRAVAVLKFEGYTTDEVARRLGCGLRTVERKLLLIRRFWTEPPP